MLVVHDKVPRGEGGFDTFRFSIDINKSNMFYTGYTFIGHDERYLKDSWPGVSMINMAGIFSSGIVR